MGYGCWCPNGHAQQGYLVLYNTVCHHPSPIQCVGQDSTSYLKVLGWKKDKRGGSEGVKGVSGQVWVVRAAPPSGLILQQSVWSFVIRVALPLLLSLVFGD